MPDSSAAQRHPWEHGPVGTRLLALVNVALIPYVAWKFPGEARDYTRRSFEGVLRGRCSVNKIPLSGDLTE